MAGLGLHHDRETGTDDRLMSFLERYVRWLVRHPWLVLVAVSVATAVVASGMRHLRTEFNVESSLPANHPFVRIDRTIREQFGGRRTLMLGIVPRNGDVWQPAVLEIVRDVTLAALAMSDVIAQNVVSLAAPSVRHVEDRDGSLETDYLMRDVPQTPEDIAAPARTVDGDPQLRGMLVTPDQRAAVVVVDFCEGPAVASSSRSACSTLTRRSSATGRSTSTSPASR